MAADLIAAITSEALPKLETYGTPKGYAALPVPEGPIHHNGPEDRMIVHIAAGDLDAARALYAAQEPTHRGRIYEANSLMRRWQRQLDAVAEPLLAGDRPALARILHGWEATNVRGTEIERYWEPTPFPLEL